MLSIIIATLNERDNLNRLLTHLDKQLDKDDEVIIVDGYSKDGTADVAREYGARVILQKPCGIGLAKTEGAANARNDILVFLDADCIPCDTFLGRIKSHFTNSNLDALAGLDLYESNSKIWKFIYDSYSRKVFCIGILMYKITGKYWIPANNGAYKKSVFFSVGGFRSVVCEDMDITQRLKPSKKVMYDDRLIVTLSDRRFRENGFFRTILLWVWSDILIIFGKGACTEGYRKC